MRRSSGDRIGLCCRCTIGKCDDVNHPCQPSTDRVNPEMCEHIANPTPPTVVSGPSSPNDLERRAHQHQGLAHRKLHRRTYSDQAELKRRRMQYQPPNGGGGQGGNNQGGGGWNNNGGSGGGGGGGQQPWNNNGGGQITGVAMTSGIVTRNSWHRQAIPGGGFQQPNSAPDFDAPPSPPQRARNPNWLPPQAGGQGQQWPVPPRQAAPNQSPPRGGNWQAGQGSPSQTFWARVPMSQQQAIPQGPPVVAPPQQQFKPPSMITGPPTYFCAGNAVPDKFYCCNVDQNGLSRGGFAPQVGVSGYCPAACRERNIVWTNAPDRHRWCVCGMCGADFVYQSTPAPVTIRANKPGWCLLRDRPVIGKPKKWQRCKVGPSGNCGWSANQGTTTCHMCMTRSTGIQAINHCWNQPQKDIKYTAAKPPLPGSASAKTGGAASGSSGMGGGTIFLIILLVLMGIGGVYYAINEQQKASKVFDQNSVNVMSGNDNEQGQFFAL